MVVSPAPSPESDAIAGDARVQSYNSVTSSRTMSESGVSKPVAYIKSERSWYLLT